MATDSQTARDEYELEVTREQIAQLTRAVNEVRARNGMAEIQLPRSAYSSANMEPQPPFDPSIFDSSVFDTGARAALTVESADWTGINSRMAALPDVVAEIVRRVEELDAVVERAGLTNTERAKAKAITSALVSLVASPEPEWRAIVTLLNSPTVAALVVATQLGEWAIDLIKMIVG